MGLLLGPKYTLLQTPSKEYIAASPNWRRVRPSTVGNTLTMINPTSKKHNYPFNVWIRTNKGMLRGGASTSGIKVGKSVFTVARTNSTHTWSIQIASIMKYQNNVGQDWVCWKLQWICMCVYFCVCVCMSVSEVAGEGDTFCTLGVKRSWNWRGQPEVDTKFSSNCKRMTFAEHHKIQQKNLTG